MKTFNLSPNDEVLSLQLSEDQETGLARISVMEDSVIEHDARIVPGYDLVESDYTGRAVFKKGDETLEVFTANRKPLERLLGVDLIYLNLSKRNIVMLQYKMLKSEPRRDQPDDWIYRPDDQFDKELSRMRQFSGSNPPRPDEYRLNPNAFFLKFVRSNALLNRGGIIMPLEHFDKIRTSPVCLGKRGGVRVSYESLSGCYLRQAPFFDLVRSGYIGAYADTTEKFKTLIKWILEAGKGAVAAIQSPMEV